MDDTAFDIWPRAIRSDASCKIKPMQVKLRAGDVIVFRGDLVHGGAATEVENVRVHCYLNAGGIVRPKHMDG